MSISTPGRLVFGESCASTASLSNRYIPAQHGLCFMVQLAASRWLKAYGSPGHQHAWSTRALFYDKACSLPPRTRQQRATVVQGEGGDEAVWAKKGQRVHWPHRAREKQTRGLQCSGREEQQCRAGEGSDEGAWNEAEIERGGKERERETQTRHSKKQTGRWFIPTNRRQPQQSIVMAKGTSFRGRKKKVVNLGRSPRMPTPPTTDKGGVDTRRIGAHTSPGHHLTLSLHPLAMTHHTGINQARWGRGTGRPRGSSV